MTLGILRDCLPRRGTHVKDLLGHESLETLRHYTRLTIGDLKRTHKKCHPRESMRTTHQDRHTPEMPTPYSAVVPHYVKCFPEYLRASGYYCTNNAKTDYQFDAPLTAWDECSSEAHWRNRPNPDQPFFAVFNPTRTHESGMWAANCPEPAFDPDDMELPPCFPDTPKVRKAMARMYTHIERSDHQLGELLQQVEEDGLADNTCVFHWSDHGPLPRDKRWKYIRNVRPDLPYLLWIPYRNRHPIVQEMWRLHMAGELNEPQSLLFQSRPTEELYDTDADPYEINNLAGNPSHEAELIRLRAALDAWLREVGDKGEVPESEMVRQWYPDRKQPQTAAPVAIPICADNPGLEPALEARTFTAPMLVQLHCATQGASIAYTFESGDTPHWLLYTQPLRITPGKTLLRARAIRIGYQESKETQISITVEAEQG